jgi:thiol-disulfide isomerase/thioredoxin
MAVEDLDDTNFEAAIKDADLAVVDFYAGWCGPCRMFKPKFKRLSGEYGNMKFYKLDGEKAPEARKTVQIDNLPYFAIYKNGEFVAGMSTAAEQGFRKFIEEHGALSAAEGGDA